ncbi:CHAT domain-containing protein [Sphingomonas radiodurans]|uniref:CHAT domain-containing protein n=1 Tax=Sphingomonas radiodurans TaxID=2890321 RepID=UPI001E4D47B3|nr:CHAT domain-containing protein [Sphingomonas radiodurans]WBH16706.1 CHAT domain-containing protein [Sphingomonas radiodurans]
MTMTGRNALYLAAAAIAVVPLSPAAAAPAPERFAVGVNSVGDTCSAARVWTSDAGPIRMAVDQPYAISCRGVSAAQAEGYVSASGKAPALDQCGASVTVTLAGIGPAEVRRCFDAQLSRSAVDVRFMRGGRQYQGAALETSLGVLENALRVVVTGAPAPAPRSVAKPTVELASLPAGPLVAATGQGGGLTAEAALTDGISSLQAGRMLDASRILNDALRQFAGTDVVTRVDLRLAAGLADSNLSQFGAADQHFAVAEQLLLDNRSLADAAIKTQQLQVYRGLHLINQRRWPDAIAALALGNTSGDLSDPVVLSRLNQEASRTRDSLQSTLADTGSIQRNLLEAQRNWALSVASLAQGDIPGAESALTRAANAARDPVRDIDPERIVWMRASIERQKGRIEARKGAIEPSLASFDCAISALQGTAPRTPAACMFAPGRALPDAAANAPLLVEAQLERASTASRNPALSPAEVLQSYTAAVQSLPDLAGTGTVSLSALERYFTLLTQAPPAEARDEEYFRAMQTIGEPGIAREYAQLQKVVSADGKVADLLRQRSDLERQLIRLRYEISASSGAATADLEALERERATADAKLSEINGKLLESNGIGALEDQPATVASVRAALAPGEVYLKVAALNTAMFGIAIAKDRTDIYQIKGSLTRVEELARTVLASARSDEEGFIKPFAVGGASQLFALVAGPAAATISGATNVIYNPAGALRQVPLAIMVSDPESAKAYAAQSSKGDYSKVAFLGRRAQSAVALSPRAFLRSRNDVAPSTAPRKFIGFGENAPPQAASTAALGQERMPFDCALTYNAWAGAVSGRTPVSAREIAIAAEALGATGAPEVTGAAFTDENLVAGPMSEELAQYQVLHFATHGIPETRIQVDKCMMNLPPSLITTLVAPHPDGRIGSDGLLSFDEVARLRLNANLVVLSACDTSAGASSEVARRRGVEDSTPALDGLVRSFIVANARAVLATFWRVPAIKQSDDLMAKFYGTGRVTAMAGALKTAQALLIEQPRYSHPYFWGAYFLVGDGEKMMLSPVRSAAK